MGKLLVLPTNVRLDWKVIARYKHSSLFGLIVSNEGKKFYNIDTRLLLLITVLAILAANLLIVRDLTDWNLETERDVSRYISPGNNGAG